MTITNNAFKNTKFPIKVIETTNKGVVMSEVVDENKEHICYSLSLEKALAIKDILNGELE